MESELNISIDKLEDQLIDNPDASTTQQLAELSYDQTFQKKLNERAEQMYNASSGGKGEKGFGNIFLLLVTKPYLEYEYKDCETLGVELSEWFVSADYEILQIKELPGRKLAFDLDSFTMEGPLDDLVYFVMGEFKPEGHKRVQLEWIKRNCQALVEHGKFSSIVDALISAIDLASKHASPTADRLFKLLTITYFIVCVEISKDSDSALAVLLELNLLGRLVRVVEEWKIDPKIPVRIRNVILLIWKLILLEFGNSEHLTKVDEYLNRKHDLIGKKDGSPKSLTCSPLEYYTFREDLLDKYPVLSKDVPKCYKPPLNEESDAHDEDTENHQAFMAANSTASLSNLLEIPRTNKAHSVLGQLPVNTLHISTPVPSPPSTPSDFMSGGEKVRKLYHVNQSMPFIYPSGSNDALPEAIKEADKLFQDAVYESYSVKRLWRERQKYMAQERGTLDHYNDSDTESGDLPDATKDLSALRSLQRVDSFYKTSLPYFSSLVKVVIEIIKSYKTDLSFRDIEQEINSTSSLVFQYSDGNTNSYDKLRQHMLKQLEGVHAKEVTLKAATSIISLLLKWFKASHVIKSHYFGSILFDEQYLNVFVDFMNNSLNNTDFQDYEENNKSFAPNEVVMAQNRLMNPSISIPQFDFFAVCSLKSFQDAPVHLINKTPISELPSKVDDDNHNVVRLTKFNKTYCHILANQLHIVNKILIKGVTQRIFAFIETKPTDLLKFILLNYINDSFKIPILKVFKKVIPFQGRKWRAMNMEVISQVYLHLKLTIRDNWLSGRDLESDFNNSFDQEIALRSLLQFYNVRKYPEEMRQLGYTVTNEALSGPYTEDE